MDIDHFESTSPKDQPGEDTSSLSSLPEKSKSRYEKTYNEFISWCKNKQIKRYTETVLLTYFIEIAKRGFIGSLCPKYYMLKSTLKLKNNVDITKFNKLLEFIKEKSEGYMPKKTKVLGKEHVEKFFSTAPNSTFLMSKVALIFGVAGAATNHELLKLETDDVQDLESKFLITIRAPKKKNRIFTVEDNEEWTVLNLIRQYISLRPAHTPHKRFFIFYNNDKCSIQPVGIYTLSRLPSRIASFLELEQPHLYTGHCLRRSSASILSDQSASIERHGGWKSVHVEEDCVETKVNVTEQIVPENQTDASCTSSISPVTQDSTTNIHDHINVNLNSEYYSTGNISTPCLNLYNCTVTNLNINIYK